MLIFLSVVPTHVGVNRSSKNILETLEGCPHARGGESDVYYLTLHVAPLSPRTWG